MLVWVRAKSAKDFVFVCNYKNVEFCLFFFFPSYPFPQRENVNTQDPWKMVILIHQILHLVQN